jgi:NADH-quinone oxidoreductase subunit C
MAAGPYIEPKPPHDVAARLVERFADAGLAVEEFRGELTVVVPAGRLIDVAGALKADRECPFEMLSAVAGLHFLEGEHEHEVVYVLYSLSRNRRINLKVRLKPGEGVPSLAGIWAGANWPEREQFDLVGIRFEGHPDLRRIIMPEDYPDHPLRKDFDVEGGASSIEVGGKPASPGFRDMEHA